MAAAAAHHDAERRRGDRAGAAPDAGWAIQDARDVHAQSGYTRSGARVLAEASTVGYFAIKDIGVEKGRLVPSRKMQRGAPVVVIGTEVAKTYFPDVDPIGRKILKLEGCHYRVDRRHREAGHVVRLHLRQPLFGALHGAR